MARNVFSEFSPKVSISFSCQKKMLDRLDITVLSIEIGT